jgi:hypothetical protein
MGGGGHGTSVETVEVQWHSEGCSDEAVSKGEVQAVSWMWTEGKADTLPDTAIVLSSSRACV